MPLLTGLAFAAHLIADSIPDNGQVYLITVDKQSKVTYLFPRLSEPFSLMEIALEYNLLSPEEELFWKKELARSPSAVSLKRARHIETFCKTNVSFEPVDVGAPQEKSRFRITLSKYDDSQRGFVFRGVVQEIIGARPNK